MRTRHRATVAFLGVASFPAVIWGLFHLAPLIADLFVLRRATAYVPAVFEAEWARFSDRTPEAVGLVAGRREILDLRDFLPRRPTGLNDLQDLMASRERIEVLYDSGGRRDSFEGSRVRVVPLTSDLRAERLRRVFRSLALAYGPAVILIGLGLIVLRRGARGMGHWLVPSLFFLGVQLLFALYVMLVDPLS